MKNRIIGALLILAVSIPIILIGGKLFSVACGILGVLGLKEFMGLKEHHRKIPFTIQIIAFLNLLMLIFPKAGLQELFLVLDSSSLSILILCLFIPCLFYDENNYSTHEAIYLIGSIIFLGVFFNSLIFIRNSSLWIFLYLVFISVFTDTFAFFIGKMFGKHKCSPKISPNKTWEGSIGGIVFGTLISSTFYFIVFHDINILKIIFLTAFLSCIGSLGDLIFSKIKRENKRKDFSNIIIGHGGILDRVDSLVFITVAYLVIINII